MSFNLSAFRTMFPEFKSKDDAYIEMMAEQAECYINKCSCKCNDLMLMLMTAHLIYIFNNTDSGSINGVLTNATIDKVSVGLKTLDTKDSWVFWLNQSSYGQSLLALIKFKAAGGFYFNGAQRVSERSAFRSAGGLYPNGGRARGRW